MIIKTVWKSRDVLVSDLIPVPTQSKELHLKYPKTTCAYIYH